MKLTQLFLFSLLVITFSTSTVIAGVYKCETSEGKTVFQDHKCSQDSIAQNLSATQIVPSKNCYKLITVKDKITEVSDFWTSRQKGNSLLYAQVNQAQKVFFSQQITTINVSEIKNNCALATIEDKDRGSFDGTVCDAIHYVTEKGRAKITPSELKSLKSCTAKHAHYEAQGFWNAQEINYPIKSSYVRYSATKNELEVYVFPFSLSKEEKKSLRNESNLQKFLNSKKTFQAENYRIFGVILSIKSDIETPQARDITQAKLLLFDNKNHRIRSYDRQWRWALNITKFQVTELKASGKVDISWVLNDKDQKSKVSISAIISQ